MNFFIIYSDVDEGKEELTGLIPLDEVPDDHIYFTFINGNVHIPKVVLRKFEEKICKDEDQNNNMVTTCVCKAKGVKHIIGNILVKKETFLSSKILKN